MYFSLVVSVYNGEKYLTAMVESILSQDFRDFELLLINDGSTDHSGVLCEEFAKKDPRVRVIHKENEGLCATRNRGIVESKADYICFLDNDDLIFPQMLTHFYESVEKGKMDFYVCGYKIVVCNAKGKIVECRDIQKEHTKLENQREIVKFYIENLGGIVAPIWNVMFSKEYLLQNNLSFNTDLKMSLDDLDFHAKSYFKAKKVEIVNYVGNQYFVRTTLSSSRKYNAHYEVQCQTVLQGLKANLVGANAFGDHEKAKFYNLVFELLVVSCIQNVVFSRKSIGSKAEVATRIMEICEMPLAIEAIQYLNSINVSNRYYRLLLNKINRKKGFSLLTYFVLKDKIKTSHIFHLLKKLR